MNYCLLFVSLIFFAVQPLYCQNLSGEISEIKGNVKVLKAGETQWYPAIEGMPVEVNDRIKTLKDSSCNMELDDGSFLLIDEKTEASVEYLELTEEKHSSKFSLWVGRILANISKSKSVKMHIKTPTSVAAVRGTEFAVEATDKETNLGVFEGEVAVNTPEGAEAEDVMVKADEETSVLKDEKPRTPAKLQEIMRRHKERMVNLREKIAQMRARLKRIPPEKRIIARKRIVERFRGIRERREHQKRLRKTRD